MAYSVPFDVLHMSFAEAMRELHETKRFGIQPMLECVEDMLEELGNPEANYDCIQIAGTNGKTSTSRYLASILAGEGLRSALYTSPELVSYTERMEIAGVPVSEEVFAHGIAAAVESGRRINERRESAGERPYDITEFDLITVAALVVYAEAGIDVCVLECGMGGRWDATSAATSIKVVGITGVGLDHTHVLGDTVEAIAAEKAAIIKPNRRCVLGVGTAAPASVEQVFLERCREMCVEPVVLRPRYARDVEGLVLDSTWSERTEFSRILFEIDSRPSSLGAPLIFSAETPYACYDGLRVIRPSYQAANITLAITLAEQYLGCALSKDALTESLVACPTPGRFDVRRSEPLALIDACHNPQSVEVFLTAVRAIEPEVSRRPALLCAALADKDVAGMVQLLAGEFEQVYVTQTTSDRALAAGELKGLFEEAGVSVRAEFDTVEEAVRELADVAYIACGSITLAGEVAALL
ncbi:MAG: bifunctional folylpolyglutamate synthase/dihydrofolate synthase [Atopobiaceae bacterium]|nr:bifunctional folylpolyglutamate synthase/dihydrofolate synthase [Atopobiaceae bacterium]